MAPLLEVAGLSKHFGGVTALSGIELTIEQGEILGIIGPNGAGKTTLFNVISGAYAPTRGKVIYGGEDVTGLSLHEVAARGIVRTFQVTTLFPDMTTFESVEVAHHLRSNTGFWGSICHTTTARNDRQAAKESALEILDFTGLAPLKNQLARNLSYGHQRLLSFAVALATNPTLLLLDEPMAGMNAKDVSVTLGILRRIRDRGVTPVLVEHNMRAIMSLSDRIVVLSFGRKIAEGTPDEMRRQPEVVKAYLGVGDEVALD